MGEINPSPIAIMSPDQSNEESKFEDISLREMKGGLNVVKQGEIR